MNWKQCVFILLIAYGAYHHFSQRAVDMPVGALVKTQPQQTSANASAFTFKSYTLTPMADFALQARVLAKEHYTFDRGADLAPVDLALGWGPMSDSQVLSQISISQSNRFYYWHVDAFPIPRRAIETHSANMHMIPANAEIAAQLKSLRVGQTIQLQGYLAHANAADGFNWKSSLTREDTGAGACELVYINTLIVQ